MKHMMLRRTFFAVLLFLFFCVTLSYATEGARGDDEGQQKKNTLFGGQETEIFVCKEDGEEIKADMKVDSFSSPALIEYEGMVAVVAEAHYTNKSEEKRYVGVVLVNLHKNGQLGKISAMLRDNMRDNVSYMLSPTVIADDEEITTFFGGYCQNDQPLKIDYSSSDCSWEPRTLTTNVRYEKIENSKKYLKWQGGTSTATDVFENNFKTDFESYLASQSIKEFIGSGGAGIKIEARRKFILPVQALKDNSIVSLIIVSTRSDIGDKWKFSKGTSEKDCANPAVLKLENDNFLMITSCKSGHYKVYESTDEGEEWRAVETLSGVWGTNKQRNGPGFRGGFITEKIGETNIIFFTQPVQETKEPNNYRLHLWATDMKHIYNVGKISADDENVSASSLLYENYWDVGEKLYCAYEVSNDEGKKNNIVVVELKDKLQKINEAVKRWEKVDEEVVKRFCSVETKSDLKATPCKDSVTDGLVGYLSNKLPNNNDGKWEDKYMCVNAKAYPEDKGAISTAAGKQFRWPKNSKGQNQPYYFANNEFTLVATVTIDKTPTVDTLPLLGVVFKNSLGEKRYGLSYTSDYKWIVTNDKEEIRKDKWTTGKQHQVVLTRKGTTLHVYIDGELIRKDDTDSSFDIEVGVSFSHFYFDAHDNKADTGVTVKDVFLYNRQLNTDEMKTLTKEKTVPAAVTKKEEPVKIRQKKPQASSRRLPKKVKKEMTVEVKGDQKELPQQKVSVELNPVTAQRQESDTEKKQVAPPTKSSEQPVVVSETENVDSRPEPADAATKPGNVESQTNVAAKTHDISGKGGVKVKNKDESRTSTVKEEQLDGKPQEVTVKEEKTEATSTTQDSSDPDVVNDVLPVGEKENDEIQEKKEEQEEKEATIAPNAAVPEAVSSESPAVDNTSLLKTTNASNHNDTLKTLLQLTKVGDGAVRSCVSLLALLPSLCLWCFLPALHCCQAIAA